MRFYWQFEALSEAIQGSLHNNVTAVTKMNGYDDIAQVFVLP